MAYNFKFPDVGEGIHEGTIVKWRVKEGDDVKADQIIAEIETDKAVVEIPSPKTGTILKLYGSEGQKINVGDILATIGEREEQAIAFEKKAEIPKEPQRGVGVVGQLEEAAEETPTTKPTVPARTEITAVKPTALSLEALPRIRMLAKELGVDLTTVTGTGPGGRITEEDLKTASSARLSMKKEEIAAPATSEVTKPAGIKIQKKHDFYGPIRHIPYTGIRRTVGEHMVQSFYTAVHVTHHDTADVTELWKLREKEKKNAEKEGIKLTFMPFIIKAAIAGLKAFPIVSSSLDEKNEDIIVKNYYNIGIAVATEEGLIVPVVKVADQKSIFQLAKEIQELAEKARTRKINLGELKGGTFTITNYGSIGGTHATPIINYPEAAILGIGKIKDTPVAIGKKVAIRKIMGISVTFDHRIFDGAIAAQFANRVIEYLENQIYGRQ